MTATDRLRRTAAERPFALGEAALLAVVVVATVAFVPLLLVSVPVVLLWADVLLLLAAAALLVLVLVGHGVVDAWGQLRGEESTSSESVLRGLWRLAEVVIAGAFLLLATLSVGIGGELAAAEPANPEGASTVGMVLVVFVLLTVALEVALVGAVVLRLGLTGGDED